jgi:hypothetical protein
LANAGVASAVAHALLVTGWIAATRPPSSMSLDSLANRVYYIPPPDKPLRSMGSREAVHYIALGEGLGVGPGPRSFDERRPIGLPERSVTPGAAPVDSVTAPASPPEEKGDSVFTILEVDSAVVRSASSAAPAYPMELLTKHVEGAVIARYVVDTTGFADLESFIVLKSSHAGFIQAVRDALPYMRFTPAKIGTRKVRQLVEQSFSFKINPGLLP